MNPRRNRRRRYTVRRPLRLAAAIAAFAALILIVILLVRGCSGGKDAEVSAIPPAPQAAPAETVAPLADTQAAQPDAQSPDAGYDDSGDEEDLALAGAGNEVVNLDADLANAGADAVPVGGRSCVIRSMGDIVAHVPLLKTAYDKTAKTYDFSPYFSEIAASMGKADYSVINVDGPLGGKKFASYRGYPQFNTPPQILYALQNAGIDMLTLANNHALDTYFDGLIGTVNNVEKVGLNHVGAYRSAEERATPKIVTINGIRVGFAAYTQVANNMEKRSDPAALEYGLAMTGNSDAPKDIAALKAAGAEIVVVYMHWGEEYEREVSAGLKRTAGKLAAAGADVIVGGHPHVVMPCEYVTAQDDQGNSRTALVLYSMGNFLSDQRARYRDSGVIFEFTLADNPDTGKVEVLNPRYVPIYVHRYTLGSGYDYRVYACAQIIANPPAGMPETVVNRVKQVWNEQKAIFETGPATAAKG